MVSDMDTLGTCREKNLCGGQGSNTALDMPKRKKKKKKGIRLEEREGRILATRQRRTHIVVVLLLTSIVLSLSPSVCV